MKKFFYAHCAVLCLMLAFHFNATSARGQGSSTVVPLGLGGNGQRVYVDCGGQAFHCTWSGWVVVDNLPPRPNPSRTSTAAGR